MKEFLKSYKYALALMLAFILGLLAEHFHFPTYAYIIIGFTLGIIGSLHYHKYI